MENFMLVDNLKDIAKSCLHYVIIFCTYFPLVIGKVAIIKSYVIFNALVSDITCDKIFFISMFVSLFLSVILLIHLHYSYFA